MRSLIILLVFVSTALHAEVVFNPLIPLTRVYGGEDGLTHFADGAVPLQASDFAPPTAPIAVSPLLASSGLIFATLPPGWFGDWHPAPRRQYVMMLGGSFEIETGDGERRTFKTGQTLLLEDVSGKGHRTRVVSDDAVVLGIVPSAQ